MRRVVVTGMGLLTTLGNDLDTTFNKFKIWNTKN